VRVAVLSELQAAMLDAVDEISAVISQDTGKSRQDAMIEVFVTLDLLNQYRRHTAEWLASVEVPRGLYLTKTCVVEHRPFGVVAVLAPWNYPWTLACAPLVAALLAGNAVIVKGSEVTAATGAMLERLLARVPALAGLVKVVHGDGAVGAAMIAGHPDFVFLTGSTATGKRVLQAAAEHLIPVVCELGGKDPMLVLADADVPAAARWGGWGAFYNAGQTCMGVERVYVHAQVYDAFVHEAVRYADEVRAAMGHSPDLEAPYVMGPLTFPRQAEIVQRHLDDALAKGARVLTGGGRDGLYFEPTVLIDVDHSMLVMQEETFGPLLPIMRVADEQEMIRLANDSDYALSASVWSRDLDHAQRVAAEVEAGSMIINDTVCHFGVPHLPFGGRKSSGFGRVHGQQGLMQFTQPYAFVIGQPPLPFDVATWLRQPGHYQLGKGLMQAAFGVGPAQRLRPARALAERALGALRARPALAAAALGAVALALFIKRR
jgi:acyl-CoA reductase-like NAD-dependent aldehyde dehydrogenase